MNQWENTGVFTREEVNALRKRGYVSEVTAELLLQLCYNVDRQDRHGDYRIEHCRMDAVPYNREQLMDLKRIANKCLEHDRESSIS
jgi:hypothetical protein